MNLGNLNQKIRVLHLIPTLGIGGAELDMVRKALVLAGTGGYEIHILPYQSTGPLAELLNSSEGITVFSPYRKGTAGMFTAALKLRALVGELKPHILHLHMFRSELVSLPMSIGGKGPIIVYTVQHMADDEPIWKRFITSRVSRNRARLVASSEAVKHSLINVVKIPEEKIEVIYNGVDFSRFDGLTHSPSPPDRPVVGTITRLHPDKGNQYLVEAFSRVVKEFPNAQCWIIGEGEERPRLEKLCRHLGLQDRMKFWGRVKEPFPLLAQMNLFVLPSNTEALGIALIEAVGLGVPAIASDVGGIPEVLDGNPDWLVPPRQPDILANKIIEVLRNYQQANIDAAKLSKRIRKKFDADELAAKQAELYRRLLGERG